MQKRSVRFCRHARFKFRVLRLHGFPVTDQQIRQAVLNPDEVMEGYKGRKIAEKRIDLEYALRVVYEEHSQEIEIITFYPVRRNP